MGGARPFLLQPAVKDYLWGGSRISDYFGKPIGTRPLAETWECSTHPEGLSLVADGPDQGRTLRDVLREHPEYLGTHPTASPAGGLPILVKLIDAREALSVQVHPDDAYALAHEGESGKDEMWYVLEAEPGAELVCGFRTDVTPEMLRGALAQGTVGQYLNHVPVRKNDVFFVRAGTIHAIGAGCLIAEVQESSDVTYRLYDYGRRDRAGHERRLQVDKAIEAADLQASAAPRQPMRVLRYRQGSASELLMRCGRFQAERLLLNTERRVLADFRTGGNSFHVLLVTEGCGVITGEDFSLNFFMGDCIFVPADSMPLRLHGRAQLLDVSC